MAAFALFICKIFMTFLLFTAHSSAVTVSIPDAAPEGAPTVDGTLFSLSIEQDRWLDWAGNSTTGRNQFFNTLDNIIQFTGAAPQLRIGADSEDRTDFKPGVQDAELIIQDPDECTPYHEAANVTVGDAFYEAARFLPNGTHVIWGVNFRRSNLTAAFLEAQAIGKAFRTEAMKDAGVILDYVEIGNEADLYIGNDSRDEDFDVAEYVEEWTTFATNVTAAAGIRRLAYTAVGWRFCWFISQCLGQFIKVGGDNCAGDNDLLQDLMTKTNIRDGLDGFVPDIKAQGLDYVLGETNSFAGHGSPGVSNSAGAALWALEYALYGKEIGVTRLYFHEGVGYKYNLVRPLKSHLAAIISPRLCTRLRLVFYFMSFMIQPTELFVSITDGSPLDTPLPPHIQPIYYAAIIAADATGDDGDTLLSVLEIDNDNITVHGFFDSNGAIKRAVFINLEGHFSDSDEERTSVHIDLDFGDSDGPTTMQIKRLHVPFADADHSLTWGGVTYETEDGRPTGEQSMTTACVSDGFDIRATEVVLLSFS
ncbi:hypothetical protein D9758_009300 [Tetrapyrgos nigripes]|uniref:Beta-glucuronidase C-terminal domain-containing protein n=1 Tax=Tetrapyrgos nigripes TaxID=182062 RepID=A0A8H5LPK3_9AGAR|nr:hypothetical protein D9758_009300 [Tetrapyrgos nigripes]